MRGEGAVLKTPGGAERLLGAFVTDESDGGVSIGTGVIYQDDLVITAAHVVPEASDRMLWEAEGNANVELRSEMDRLTFADDLGTRLEALDEDLATTAREVADELVSRDR